MIQAEGRWQSPLFSMENQWDINYSSILTQLIQWAGRYTEDYASDLYIIWKYCVDKKMYDRELESYSLLFGFRKGGIDDQIIGDKERMTVEENMNANRYYYRKVARLDIEINGNEIKMILKEEN